MDEPVGIGPAVEALEAGAQVGRSQWIGRHLECGMSTLDDQGRVGDRLIFFITSQGERIPWLPTSRDLLAKDYKILGRS